MDVQANAAYFRYPPPSVVHWRNGSKAQSYDFPRFKLYKPEGTWGMQRWSNQQILKHTNAGAYVKARNGLSKYVTRIPRSGLTLAQASMIPIGGQIPRVVVRAGDDTDQMPDNTEAGPDLYGYRTPFTGNSHFGDTHRLNGFTETRQAREDYDRAPTGFSDIWSRRSSLLSEASSATPTPNQVVPDARPNVAQATLIGDGTMVDALQALGQNYDGDTTSGSTTRTSSGSSGSSSSSGSTNSSGTPAIMPIGAAPVDANALTNQLQNLPVVPAMGNGAPELAPASAPPLEEASSGQMVPYNVLTNAVTPAYAANDDNPPNYPSLDGELAGTGSGSHTPGDMSPESGFELQLPKVAFEDAIEMSFQAADWIDRIEEGSPQSGPHLIKVFKKALPPAFGSDRRDIQTLADLRNVIMVRILHLYDSPSFIYKLQKYHGKDPVVNEFVKLFVEQILNYQPGSAIGRPDAQAIEAPPVQIQRYKPPKLSRSSRTSPAASVAGSNVGQALTRRRNRRGSLV